MPIDLVDPENGLYDPNFSIPDEAPWPNKSKPKTPGSFSINTFISDIRSRGVVKTNSFMVNIVPPKILRDRWSDTRNILIRCDSASLPAVNFQMAELYRYGFGPQESNPHNIQFEPVNLTFLMDAKAEIYSFWYSWVNGIMNFNRQNGLNSKDKAGKNVYELAYKRDFSTEIKVLVYNEVADNIIQASMLEAYPMGIQDIGFNWMNTDDVVRMNVPITYRDFYSQMASPTQQEVFTFLSDTVPTENYNKSYLKDTFKTIGFDLLDRASSKLDRLISDIIF